MSAVLGISAHYHDAAAALVVDGEIVGALQQERLTRVKHDPSLPIAAAERLLSDAGMSAGDLDRVVFYEDPFSKIERILVHGVRTFPGSFRALRTGLMGQLSDKLWVLDGLARGLGVRRDRVGFVSHHHSHAASTLFTSGWTDAAVLTVDGVGEWQTTTLWHGDREGLHLVGDLEFPHSLGLLYAAITAWLGFAVNSGEYKVMGLAAFGEPTRVGDFESLVHALDDGSFALDSAAFSHFNDPTRGFGPGVIERLGPPRQPGRPWSLDDPDFKERADVAASLQVVVEERLLALLRVLHERTGMHRLCLAGGVALNAVANRRLAAEGPFAAMYVHPAAGDAGGALGAALADVGQAGFQPFLGIAPDVARCREVAEHLGFVTRTVDDPDAEIASRLGAGELVGVCRGRCEWGPRALGARSLLANPTLAGTRDHLNRVVKRREPFRPFAPAVSVRAFEKHFHGRPDRMTPFMTTVRSVRGDALKAVTHVDGTARVQSVGDDQPLSGVLRHTDVVLNTSLNGSGEPICGSGVDALSFLLKHPIDAVYIEDLEVTR